MRDLALSTLVEEFLPWFVGEADNGTFTADTKLSIISHVKACIMMRKEFGLKMMATEQLSEYLERDLRTENPQEF